MGNGGKRGLAAVGLVILLTILFCLSARAEEVSVWTEEGSVSGDLGEYDFSQVEEWVREEMDGGEEFSFTELLGLLMSGQLGEAAGLLARTAGASLADGLAAGAGFLGQVVVLGLSGAVFAGFAGVFRTGQISETGFFITYLLLCALLAAGFGEGVRLAGETLGQVLEFMRALMPAYFLAVAFSGGAVTAAGLYECMLFLLTGVQWLFLSLFLPGIQICFLLMLAGHMVKEDMLSRFRDLVGTGISWGVKTLMGLVVGFHLLQGLVLPYADAVKNSGLIRVMEVIPGIGGGVGAAANMVMGSGVLIKNTIGAGAVFVLAVIALAPVVKLVILAFLYQLAAAVLEPVCDRRITGCVSEAAEGYRMLVRLTASALALFVISIAMICAATNVTYYAGGGGSMETAVVWVKNLVFYTIFLAMILHLLPSGSYEKYVRLLAGMVFLLVAAAPFTVSLRLDDKLAGYAAQFSFQDEAAGFRGELEDMEEKRRGRLGEIYSRAVEEQVEEMAAEAGIQVREVRAEIGMDPDREDFGQVTEVSLVWVRPSEFGAEPEKEPGAEPGERVEKIEEVEPVRIGALRGEENREEENQEEGNRGEGSRVEAAPAGAKPALSGEDERAARALVRRIAEACHMEEGHVEIQLEYE